MNAAQKQERNALKQMLFSPDFLHQKSDYFLRLFRYQYTYNPLYGEFCRLLGKNPEQISDFTQIPHLPISFFKTHKVSSRTDEATLIFESSGTTGTIPSRHLLYDEDLYIQSFLADFTFAYGNPQQFCFLFLLPGYMERQGSSLIYMAEYLKNISPYSQSGFYLRSNEALLDCIAENKERSIPTILWGVSFALLDLAESGKFDFSHCIVMETGGMKGRRIEPTREALHACYSKQFGIQDTHSEYGMTELLSQAYSKGKGKFIPSPKMHISIFESEDPLTETANEKTGRLHIIDGANIDSCAFIATQDLGKKYADGSFEIVGRMDHSDLRGCSLLTA